MKATKRTTSSLKGDSVLTLKNWQELETLLEGLIPYLARQEIMSNES